MFKKMLFLFLTAAIALSACSTLEVRFDQTPTVIAAETLSAIPSLTLIPNPTATFTPIPTKAVQPQNIYQNSNFGFECLYPTDMFFHENTGFDDLIFSVSFVRLKDRGNSYVKITAELAISMYENPNKLPIEQWLAEKTKPDSDLGDSAIGFLSTSDPVRLNVNGHHAIVFEGEQTMIGSLPRVLIENGKQIVSISYYTAPSVSLREAFLIAVSSFKFSLSKDDLAIDNELYQDMDRALLTLSY